MSFVKGSLVILITLVLLSCEHRGFDVVEYSGDYRVFSGIAEFYDCKAGVKYYVADAGIYEQLKNEYLKLDVKDRDDVYLKVKGYLKEEEQIEGIDRATVFVAVKFISFELDRGCESGTRAGY